MQTICACALTAGISLLGSGGARAETADYAIAERAWNGLSELAKLANDSGIEIESPTEVRVNELVTGDALLLVHPTRDLPGLSLSAFMRDGGRLAIADDFGAGGAFLRRFRIDRRPPEGIPKERRLRGNPNLVIATPVGSHPLTTMVQALVVNHPATVRHQDLEPVFSLDNEGKAVVLAGAVGAGRLIAIGDPSALINNMLAFHGNRRFARNLLAFLAQGEGGRVVIATGATPVLGDGGLSNVRDPMRTLRQALGRVASLALPAEAVRIATWALALALVLAALSGFPRRLESERALPLAQPSPTTGFPGEVNHYAKSQNLFEPLMAYRTEFERALCERLSVPQSASRRELVDAFALHIRDTGAVAQCSRLLEDLSELDAQRNAGNRVPRIKAARFRALVGAGRSILDRLDG